MLLAFSNSSLANGVSHTDFSHTHKLSTLAGKYIRFFLNNFLLVSITAKVINLK